jgi:hypothetical protein
LNSSRVHGNFRTNSQGKIEKYLDIEGEKKYMGIFNKMKKNVSDVALWATSELYKNL